MKRSQDPQDALARLRKRATQAVERFAVARARLRELEKKNEATRRYRLGLIVESFIFEEPELLARVEELVRMESLRVRAAFALDQSPSWLEQPVRDDPKKVVETRRVRLGMVIERLLPGDAQLAARLEALIREQSPHVRSVFCMDGFDTSWFHERLRVRD